MKGSKPGERRGGRTRGTPNKITGALREMILGALAAKGGQAWLEKQTDKNPVAFMALLGKILPMQITGAEDGPLVIRWEHDVREASDDELREIISAGQEPASAETRH
jgi:hypothetical protein